MIYAQKISVNDVSLQCLDWQLSTSVALLTFLLITPLPDTPTAPRQYSSLGEMQDEINRAAANTNPYDQVSLSELNRETDERLARDTKAVG